VLLPLHTSIPAHLVPLIASAAPAGWAAVNDARLAPTRGDLSDVTGANVQREGWYLSENLADAARRHRARTSKTVTLNSVTTASLSRALLSNLAHA
jgi:hypothetical protein